MSLTVLPPLCPTVAKVSIILSCPKQKSPTSSQQALFSLLKKRRERYLAKERRRRDEPQNLDRNVQSSASLWPWEGTDESKHHSLGAADSNHSSISLPKLHTTTKGMCKEPSHPQTNIRPSISLPECGNSLSSSDTSCKRRVGNARRDRNQSLLRNLECSELAEYVVQRAKVRLERRQKRRANLLKRHAKLPCIRSDSSLHSQQQCVDSRTDTQRHKRVVPRSADIDMKQKAQTHPYLSGSVGSKHLIASKKMISPYALVARDTTRHSDGDSLHVRGSHTSDTSKGNSCCQLEEKLKVIYLSERQSVTPKATGIPNAPPATPSPTHSQSLKFIPCLNDIKSQRLLRNRLHEMISKLDTLKKSQQDSMTTREEVERKEAVAKLRIKQRAEIYALNKIMTEYEEEKFQAYLSAKV